MSRTVSGLCFVAAVGLATTLGAQSPTTTTASPSAAGDREVTISGCLSKTAGGYMLNNARVEPTASASTTTAPGATTTAGTTGSTTTAGATGTSGGAAEASPAMTWMLSGDSDLEKHVGHKIQVTGKTSWKDSMEHGRTSTSTASGAGTTAAPPSAATSTGTSTTAGGSADQPRLDVKSIKMVSTSCS